MNIYEYWSSKSRLVNCRKTGTRQAKLLARMKEAGFVDNYEHVIDMINDSDFLVGINERGWKATIDWLLQNDTNYVKVLEGRYINGKPTTTETDWNAVKKHHAGNPSTNSIEIQGNPDSL